MNNDRMVRLIVLEIKVNILLTDLNKFEKRRYPTEKKKKQIKPIN